MQQWVLPAGVTDPDGLVVGDVPVPAPGPGDVRIRVQAVSTNARDTLILNGTLGRIEGRSIVPLSDVAGVVDAVGAEVSNWSNGDRVTNLHFSHWEDGPAPDDRGGLGLGAMEDDGVLAEYVVLPADRVTRAPGNLTAVEASTLPVAGVTAWNVLMAQQPVGPGSTVVTIGSGGVSLFALQIARAHGARVVAMGRECEQGVRLLQMGASDFVNSTEVESWAAAVQEVAGGATTVVDTIGIAAVNDCLAALAAGGSVAVIGLAETTSPPLEADALVARQLVVRGISVGSSRMHRDLVAAVEQYDIHPVIDRTFTFADAPAAFRAQAGKGIFGKFVIEVS